MLRRIETVHAKIKPSKIFRLFTWGTRILLAIAFLPSGFTKFIGNRFTQISVEDPVGFYFEAFYQTGWYYNFIGLMQLLVALLLLIPKTSYFATLLYLPIIINIFCIVTSMHFTGTPIVTGLMLLAVLYLLFWDLYKTKSLLNIIFVK